MKILVAGSAHIDILASAHGDPDTIDQIGHVDLAIGGTASNLALNLRKLGVDVVVLTAASRSPFSTFVVGQLSKAGVSVLVDPDDDLPLAAFPAHISADGELVSAISAAPVERHVFSDEMIEAALDGVDALIIDCNLLQQTLEALAQAACARMVPIYVAGVSEEKCLRMASIAAVVDAVFLNEREAVYFARRIAPDLEGRLSDLATRMGTIFIVTQGDRGALVARPYQHRVALVPPVPLSSVANTLGMGDAFMAGAVFAHLVHGFSFDEGAAAMLPLVTGTAHEVACNSSPLSDFGAMLADLQQKACICPTTGILNRASAEEAMSLMILGACEGRAAFSIALIDVDFFKKINDSLGHNVGDLVLERVAGAIRGALRQHDKVGRWGGDEFIALIFGDLEVGVQVGNRMRESVAVACADICPVTLSIGVAQWQDGLANSLALVKEADLALYEVKRNGRDGCLPSSSFLSRTA